MVKLLIMIIIILISLITFIFAEKVDAKESEVEQFVNLYVDLSIAAETYLDDSLKLVEVQDSVFNEHEMSKEEFDDFRKKIDEEPEAWSSIWRQVVKKLEEKDKQAAKQKRDTLKKEKEEESKQKN